ncbi:MAG: CBM35 domain-containing protein, partial [Chloroflexota bacterium]
ETVRLKKDSNTIKFEVKENDTGNIQLDYIEITNPQRLQAEQGTGAGNTTQSGSSGNGYIDLAKPADNGNSGETTQNKLTFSPTVSKAGDYTMKIRYATSSDETTNRTVSLTVNNAAKSKQLLFPKTSTEKPWATISETVRLKKDSNTIKFEVKTGDTGKLKLYYIEIEFSGKLRAEQGKKEGNFKIEDSWILLNGVNRGSLKLSPDVWSAGSYDMTIRYSADQGEYDRTLSLIVNGGTPKQLTFAKTDSWSNWSTRSEPVTLKAGSNTIEFRGKEGDTALIAIDYIEIANLRRLQAEQGTAEGSATKLLAPTTPNGFDGSGYVNLAKPADSEGSGETPQSKLTFSPTVPKAGDYTMKIRYATSGDEATDRTISLTVGSASPKQLSFPKTSTEKPWVIISETVSLTKDSNTTVFEVKDTDTGNLHLDYIDFWLISEVSEQIGSLAVHPKNKDILIAGQMGGGGVYLSRDGGKLWQELTRPRAANGRVEVCFTDPNLNATDQDQVIPAYIFVEQSHKSASGYLWRFINDGTNAELEHMGVVRNIFGSSGNDGAGQGYYDICIWAGDPSDTQLIVVGGVDLARSIDGGQTFKKIGGSQSYGQSPSLYRFPHVDQHFLIKDPRYSTSNRRLWLGNDGGIYTTDDIKTVEHHATNADKVTGKGQWEARNNGYTVTQFYYGTGNPQTRVVIAGAQDNGTHSHTPGNYDWDNDKVTGGDGAAVAFDPNDSNRFYASTQELDLMRVTRDTTNGATTWAGETIKPDLGEDKPGFIAPFRLDPKSSKVGYAGATALWRMNDFPEGTHCTVSMTINDTNKEQISFDEIDWENEWGYKTTTQKFALTGSENTIKFRVNNEDTGCVGIDTIHILDDKQLEVNSGNTLSKTTSKLTFSTPELLAAVKYEIKIEYTCIVKGGGSSLGSVDLYVNNGQTAQPLAFDISGSLLTEKITAPLKKGANIIEFRAKEDFSGEVTITSINLTGSIPKMTSIRPDLKDTQQEDGSGLERGNYMKAKTDKVTYTLDFSHKDHAGDYKIKIKYKAKRDNPIRWTKLAPKNDNKTPEGVISAIAVGSTSSPLTGDNYSNELSNLILLGYSGGEIWRTTNANVLDDKLDAATPTWKKVGPKASRKCLCITIDPKNNYIYAGFGGFQDQNLMRSTDGGDTWIDISGRLPNVPVHSITMHPQDSNWLYAGTDIGLFASEDGGITWAVANEGPASVAVTDMFWLGTTLCVVTFGRGIFQIDIPRLTTVEAIIVGDTEGNLRAILPGTATEAENSTAKAAVEKTNVELSSGEPSLSPIATIHSVKSLSDTSGETFATKVADTLFVGDSLGNLHWRDCNTLADKRTTFPKQLSFAKTSTSEPWQIIEETVTLGAGQNSVEFEVKSGDTGNIQLDYIELNTEQLQAEQGIVSGEATISSTPATPIGFAGNGFITLSKPTANAESQESKLTLTPTVQKSGDYVMKIRYATIAEDSGARTASLTVTKPKLKQTKGAIKAQPELWENPVNGHLCVVVTDAKGYLHIFNLEDETKAPVEINVLGLPEGETAKIYSNEIVDNWAYVVSNKGIYAVRLVGDQPGVEWKNMYVCQTAPLLAAHTLYVGHKEGDSDKLSALHLRTGEERWASAENILTGPLSKPVWSIGTVVVGTKNSVVGFDHTNGTRLFSKTVEGKVEAITADDAILYFVSKKTLHKSRIVSATPPAAWALEDVGTADVGEKSHYAPLLVGDKIYVAGNHHDLLCYDANPPKDSTALTQDWKFRMAKSAHATPAPVYPASTTNK